MTYPNNLSEFREIENRPDVVYDPEKKTRVYAQDIIKTQEGVNVTQDFLGTKDEWGGFRPPEMVAEVESNLIDTIYQEVENITPSTIPGVITGYTPTTGQALTIYNSEVRIVEYGPMIESEFFVDMTFGTNSSNQGYLETNIPMANFGQGENLYIEWTSSDVSGDNILRDRYPVIRHSTTGNMRLRVGFYRFRNSDKSDEGAIQLSGRVITRRF